MSVGKSTSQSHLRKQNLLQNKPHKELIVDQQNSTGTYIGKHVC
jgi:hypothetical protein